MNNAMKELYEALQGIQHYSQKAMQAMQQMSGSMGQRGGGSGGYSGGSGGYSGGGSMGQRDGMDWENMGQKNGNMPFNPMMFM